jgi:hypothetical protein
MTSLLAFTLSATLVNTPALPSAPPRLALVTQALRFADAPVTVAPPGGDSLTNGAVTGAVIAGLTSAVVLGYLCHVFNETGDPICVKQVAWRSAVAAAGGAAVGAGIDAMMDRQAITRPERRDRIKPGMLSGPSIALRVRF